MSNFDKLEKQRIEKLKHEWPPNRVKCKKARQCTSKHRYRDIELAKNILHRFPNQRIYSCNYCNGYHLTKFVNFEIFNHH